MSTIIVYTIVSFLLDGLVSNFISGSIHNSSMFNTIYSVIALVIIYNYFDNNSKFLKILFVLGILFDIVYTNTFLLNIFIFIVIYIILGMINNYIPNNIFTINVKTLLAVFIYHILSYIILSIANYDSYSYILLMVLPRSVIMTIIYTSFSYIMIKKIYFKRYTKKIK